MAISRASGKTAGDIALQMDVLDAKIAQLDKAIAENWQINSVNATAPDTGSSEPAGTVYEFVQQGRSLNAADSNAIYTNMRNRYQNQLTNLATQLAALT